jgi:hypothetical protein
MSHEIFGDGANFPSGEAKLGGINIGIWPKPKRAVLVSQKFAACTSERRQRSFHHG